MQLSNTSAKKGSSRTRARHLNHTLILFGVGCLLIVITILVKPFYSINLWLTDRLFTSETASPNIVVVGIDDNTLDTYGLWQQWSRDLHAQAIDNLKKAEAKVIGFDVLFADSSPDDAELAAAMEDGQVVLAVAGIEPMPRPQSAMVYNRFLFPASSLKKFSTAIGHVNLVPDPDGKVRNLPLIVRDGDGRSYPAFVLAVLHSLFSMQLPQDYALIDGSLQLLARNIPADDAYNLRINYSACKETFSYLSYGDVIRGTFEPALVKNKIILVGMTATGELDTWKIPTSAGNVSGVYIHAIASDTILRQRFLTETGTGTVAIFSLLLVGIIAFALPRLRLKWGIAVTGGLFLLTLVASFIAFDSGHIIPYLYLLLPVPVLYVTSILCLVIFEQSDKRFVQDVFGRYVSPQVSQRLLSLADGDNLKLGGERREVTVLFADIRGFTRISEQLSPESLVDMLNAYFAVIIEEVMKHGGIVNKFAGDNIMAVWNTPQFQPDHARLAIKAAWESQQKLAQIQQRDSSLPFVQFGIGINSGDTLAGNIGSLGRSEYTVIGDAVNLASRICSAAPGGEIWISAETYHHLGEDVYVEELQPQEFKGKSSAVTVYRIIGWK